MTLRVHVGIDPGQSGAIVILPDGRDPVFIDMPTSARKAGGQMVDGATLAAGIRDALREHSGAYVMAIIEQVGAMPNQGSSSGFRFGQSDGIVRGVIGALGIPLIEVAPAKWKRHFGLIGTDKDCARTLAIQRFPGSAQSLSRKKDIGRADALLIAAWGHATEQV